MCAWNTFIYLDVTTKELQGLGEYKKLFRSNCYLHQIFIYLDTNDDGILAKLTWEVIYVTWSGNLFNFIRGNRGEIHTLKLLLPTLWVFSHPCNDINMKFI